MQFLDDVKRRMMAAMKAGDTVQKEVLRVVVGEVTMGEARGVVKTDDDAMNIVRKLVKSNEETASLTSDEAQKQTLARECEVLRALLPRTLTVDEIVAALAGAADAIRAEANDGKATGAAMKALKAQGALVEGRDVTAAVKRLRAGG
ncbi:MAG: GatB/YqeY domain-containing protein [Polyangiales bacterium]